MTDYAFAKRLLDDGASHPEAARTIGVSVPALKARFPGHEWTQTQKSAQAIAARAFSTLEWNGRNT